MKKIFLGLLVALIVLGGAAFGVSKYYLDKVFSTPKQVQSNSSKSTQPAKPYFTKPVNILVLGADQRPNDHGRSDTIMIYHLDPITNKIGLLSVPRDTYVNISGRGMDKVNHAYAFGGVNLSQKTLEEFLGIKIDYYMVTNFAGFTDLIDTLGGINVYVEKDIRGTDIKMGQQKLDGMRALQYVRDRKDPMGDIARVRRQQKFMKALALEISSYSPKYKLVLQIPKIYKSINTNLPLDGALGLNEMVQKLDLENAQIEDIPGTFYNYKGISYWKPDKIKTDATVQQIFFSSSSPVDSNANKSQPQ